MKTYRAIYENPDTEKQVTSIEFEAANDDAAWQDKDALREKHGYLIVTLYDVRENYK